MTTTPQHYGIERAQISLREDATPVSEKFNDVYYSAGNGLAESSFVFLEHNQLKPRWQATPSQQPTVFTIFEAGFGSGLNFLNTWRLWSKTATPADSQLHYLAIEKHPLRTQDLKTVLQQWPELKAFSEALIAAYPPTLRGLNFRRLNIASIDKDIKLTLIFDDIANIDHYLMGSEFRANKPSQTVDAWFLDGFSPAKNPNMWSEKLFDFMSIMSKPGATFSTFSAAAVIRDSLESRAFKIQKVAGFGKKRHMLTGEKLPVAIKDEPPPLKNYCAWHILSKQRNPNPGKTATVIGAGLAGCHTASALAQRGWQVKIIEQESAVAMRASGNNNAILYSRLPLERNNFGDFNLASLHYARQHYQDIGHSDDEKIRLCGLLQIATSEKQKITLQKLATLYDEQDEWLEFVDAQTSQAIAGLEVGNPAIYFKESGYINPTQVCKYLIHKRGITLHPRTSATRLEKHQQRWRVFDSSDECIGESDIVVISNAFAAKKFQQCSWLPLKDIRGQISYVRENPQSSPLNTVICHDGYITPQEKGVHCIGATYTPHNDTLALSNEDHTSNLQQLADALPQVGMLSAIGGRAELRCTTPDYLPLVGPVPIYEKFLEDFQTLSKDASTTITTPGSYHPGLYLNVGHGSRGVCYTPLSAELIGSLIEKTWLPVSYSTYKALSPARFIIRNIIRGTL